MGAFLVIAAVIVGIALAANALLNVLGRSGGGFLVGGTFIVVAAGAYATAFVFDMVTLAWTGELPAANIVWPCITWSLISVSALVVGAGRSVPFAARAMPFWIVGGLAMLSSLVHSRNVVAAIALILAGIAYGSAGAQQLGPERNARGEPKVRRGLAPRLGPYYFGMKSSDVDNLVELTVTEKEALSLVVEFKNERIYHAPPAEFAGASWDIVLGAVDEQVYKVSALLLLENREQRDGVWRNLEAVLGTRLGAPATATTTIIAWDTEDGNVVVNRAEASGAYAAVLTLTSRAASEFARVPTQTQYAQSHEFVQSTTKELQDEVRIHPNNYEAWGALGAAYGKLHRYDDAVTSFKRAITINPKSADAYLGLASTYGFMGRTQEQIDTCKQAIKLDPRNARAHSTLGAAYGKTEQYKESIRELKEALRLQPDFAEAHYGLGVAYLFSGDTAAAVKEADALERLDPKTAAEFRGIIQEYKKAR